MKLPKRRSQPSTTKTKEDTAIADHGRTSQAGTRCISGLLQQLQNQGKTEGPAACNSQTASPFGCLNNFYFRILSNFLGSLQFAVLTYFFILLSELKMALYLCVEQKVLDKSGCKSLFYKAYAAFLTIF